MSVFDPKSRYVKHSQVTTAVDRRGRGTDFTTVRVEVGGQSAESPAMGRSFAEAVSVASFPNLGPSENRSRPLMG